MDDLNKKAEEQGAKAKKAAVGYMLFELGLEFAVMIAGPLIGAIFLGRWLERKYDSKLFIVGAIFLALGLSSYMIYRKILDARKMMK
jgi:hypothetical protein